MLSIKTLNINSTFISLSSSDEFQNDNNKIQIIIYVLCFFMGVWRDRKGLERSPTFRSRIKLILTHQWPSKQITMKRCVDEYVFGDVDFCWFNITTISVRSRCCCELNWYTSQYWFARGNKNKRKKQRKFLSGSIIVVCVIYYIPHII